MEDQAKRSSYIFELAEEVGIPLELGRQDVFGDEALLYFVEKYQAWTAVRDGALKKHLTQTPNLFRCYLPYSPHILGFAYQVLWYLDEIVVRDPIENQIDIAQAKDLERIKSNLRQTIQLLNQFRHAIESGYLLLFGSDLVPPLGDTPDEVIQLLDSSALVHELDQAVRFGMERRPDSQGKEWIVWDAQMNTGSVVGFSTHITEPTTSPRYQIGEQLSQVTAEELKTAIDQDVFNHVRHLYPKEVHRTVRALGLTSTLNSAVMFNRSVDAAIVSAASHVQFDPSRQDLAVGSFNLALPYIKNLPAEKLIELRYDMPDAFIEFRTKLADIIRKAKLEDPDVAIEYLQLQADREIVPQLRDLDAAMQARMKKLRLSVGIQAAVTSGVLIGAAANIGLQSLLPLAVGGSIGLMTLLSRVTDDAAAMSSNPFWFLWQAQK